MILIENCEDLEKYYFPKNKNFVDNEIHTLKLHSNSTLKDYNLTLEDKETLSDFYCFVYDWSEIQHGEYEYEIIYDNVVCSKGLIRFGKDFDNVRKENKKEYNNKSEYKYYGE